MFIKKNARVTFRSNNRRTNFKRNNNSYSNGKAKNKGNIVQQYTKYLKMAKEHSSSGDRIQSEYYYQFTDHYYRLMLELGINLDDNDSNQEDKLSDNPLQNTQESNVDIEKKVDKSETIAESSSDEDISSIESIPFISEPVKKKVVKSKKNKI